MLSATVTSPSQRPIFYIQICGEERTAIITKFPHIDKPFVLSEALLKGVGKSYRGGWVDII